MANLFLLVVSNLVADNRRRHFVTFWVCSSFPSRRLCADDWSFPKPAVASLLLFEPHHSKYTKLCVCKTVKYSLRTPVSSNCGRKTSLWWFFFWCLWVIAVDSSGYCSARGRDHAARCSQWACARLAVCCCRRIDRRNCPSYRYPRQGLGTSRQLKLLVGGSQTR
jgi:hypothetical protein